MILKDLLVRIGFETDEAPLEKIEGHIERLKVALEAFAAVEVVKKLFEVSERFAHWGEQLANTSVNLGITTEELQRLNFAAEQSGVSAEEMSHGLSHLARQLYEAKTGSVAAQEAFRKAGIPMDQVRSFKNAEDAMLALSGALEKQPDQIRKMGIAQELLGRAGTNFIAFLSKGSGAIKQQGDELQKLGLILSGHQIEALAETEHAFQRLHAALAAIGAQIASQIGPAFVFLIDKFLELYAANKNLIGTNIRGWLDSVGYGLGFLGGLIYGTIQLLIELAKHFNIEGSILPGLMKIIGIFSGLLAVGGALTGLGAIASFVAPMLALGAAITAVVVGIHDLWALLNHQPTWSGSIFDSLKNAFDKIDFSSIGTKLAITIGDAIKSAFTKFLPASITGSTEPTAVGGAQPEGFLSRAAHFFGGDYLPNGPQSNSSSNSSVNSRSTSINAPITIHVGDAADPRNVGEQIVDHLMGILDSEKREAQWSVAPAVGY